MNDFLKVEFPYYSLVNTFNKPKIVKLTKNFNAIIHNNKPHELKNT